MLMKNILILVFFIINIQKSQLQNIPKRSANNYGTLNNDLVDNQIEELLNDYLKEDDLKSHQIPPRDKKNRPLKEEEENSPIEEHRKKNGPINSNDLTERTCSSQFKLEPNLIIDSKGSLDKGAKLVEMVYISKETASVGLNKLQESCMNHCCNSETCDSALLSMHVGLDGYRCYLFACNQNCLYVRHNDYIVLRMKSAEQLDHSILSKESNVITTGHKDQNEYNMNGELNVISNFDQDDKIYFSEKENAITPTSSIVTAIILLILGISLVIALFTYLIMSTKYVSKRVKWIKKFNMKHKNVDVDPTLEADYLINGMYL